MFFFRRMVEQGRYYGTIFHDSFACRVAEDERTDGAEEGAGRPAAVVGLHAPMFTFIGINACILHRQSESSGEVNFSALSLVK